MENIKSLMERALRLFPDSVNISDGEILSGNGFFSKNLSSAWHEAEDRNGAAGNNVDFMIWAIFRLLHRKSRENYLKGIYSVTLSEISIDSIEKEYNKVKR